MLKVAIIIASKNFQDEEFFRTQEILKKADIQVVPVSDKIGLAKGSEGGEVNVTDDLKALSVSMYDALIFIGGIGALKYLDNPSSYHLIQEALAQDKIIGAICIAPLILAKAGVLKGKKATVWSSPLNQQFPRILKDLDVHYLSRPVVRDEMIVTANGPSTAELFGQTLVRVLTK